VRRIFLITSFLSIVGIYFLTTVWSSATVLYFIILPLITIGVYDMVQTKHTLLRNFPVVGWGRYFMEILRPKIYQYFIESDLDGRPISRIFRSVVYQRAKGAVDTTPFGTQLDVYRVGYEWMSHSLNAINGVDCEMDLRINVGSSQCTQPYSSSIFNISAMSYGSLSKNAILALNGGARIGKFSHNTGEGGLSPYHADPGGDLVWQIGTGYFGCRDDEGEFSPTLFAETANSDNVKMIEIKLSQGAKPGHGGILPAKKNTPEIAAIRNVKPYTAVISPPAHSTFSNPIELLNFVKQLRELSGGKPIGIKLCVGNPREFFSICKGMRETGIYIDFISVDGGEGGTGAAPLEYSNSVGMPLRDGLALVVDCLNGFDLKKEVTVIASGKIISGFQLIQNLALGADITNSARAMMLALGCIQALDCNKNTCPTGITTQDPQLMVGLVVKDKEQRVANYQKETIRNVVELLSAAGLHGNDGLVQLNRSMINRRASQSEVMRYVDIFPDVSVGSFLNNDIPKKYIEFYNSAEASAF